jgi:hypothetical protein
MKDYYPLVAIPSEQGFDQYQSRVAIKGQARE